MVTMRGMACYCGAHQSGEWFGDSERSSVCYFVDVCVLAWQNGSTVYTIIKK
jgi:hypothetical protein